MSCNLYLASKVTPPFAALLVRRILLLLLILKVANALNTLRNSLVPLLGRDGWDHPPTN